jgi:triacylglycerol lipase
MPSLLELTSSTMIAHLEAPIVLAHGLFGFSRIGVGPVTLTSYFRRIPEALRESGNRVLTTRVPPIAGIGERARHLAEQIDFRFPDERVHIIGHSMGGLDARRLLDDPSWRGRVLSLTTIGTPHLGSTLADFAKIRVGRIFRLLSALGIDPAGCLDVTRRAARHAHRLLGHPAGVLCSSIAGDPDPESVSWPLKRLHAALHELEGPNDGLVSVESALAFGTPLDSWRVDHLQQLNWLVPGLAVSPHSPILDLYAKVLEHLIASGFAGTIPARESIPAEIPSRPKSLASIQPS